MGCVGFFKSSWTDIRANAAIFVGFLLGNLQDDMTISKEHVSNGKLSIRFSLFSMRIKRMVYSHKHVTSYSECQFHTVNKILQAHLCLPLLPRTRTFA